MTYKIHPDGYRRVFVLPKSLVEDHIKLAGALQLKVLLWVYYHQEPFSDCSAMAADLGASPSDIQDALQYWIVNGVIQPSDSTIQSTPKPETTVKKEVVKVSPTKVVSAKTQKPNRSEVAKRGQESPEIGWLLSEAQNKFSRTLTFSELSTLVWLIDTYGLSPGVILMVIEYAVSLNQCNIKFIEKNAIDWYKNDIDTIEKAEEYLTRIEATRNNWNTVRRSFGIDQRKATKQEALYVERWIEEWCFSGKMLQEAYNRCVDNTGKISFPYINKVLEKWYTAGFKKPSDIVEDYNKPKKSRGLKKTSDSGSSYDIDEIQQMVLSQGGE